MCSCGPIAQSLNGRLSAQQTIVPPTVLRTQFSAHPLACLLCPLPMAPLVSGRRFTDLPTSGALCAGQVCTMTTRAKICINWLLWSLIKPRQQTSAQSATLLHSLFLVGSLPLSSLATQLACQPTRAHFNWLDGCLDGWLDDSARLSTSRLLINAREHEFSPLFVLERTPKLS